MKGMRLTWKWGNIFGVQLQLASIIVGTSHVQQHSWGIISIGFHTNIDNIVSLIASLVLYARTRSGSSSSTAVSHVVREYSVRFFPPLLDRKFPTKKSGKTMETRKNICFSTFLYCRLGTLFQSEFFCPNIPFSTNTLTRTDTAGARPAALSSLRSLCMM